MEFIYATELKQRYQVYAHFYYLSVSKNKWLCRSVADIVDISALSISEDDYLQRELISPPNAVVVMMNPGAARPITSNTEASSSVLTLNRTQLFDFNHHRRRLAVAPDNAQYQLMRLMKRQHWCHLRIINLSDLCEGNSQNFANLHKTVGALDARHPESLLHQNRNTELDCYLQDVSKIIVAWGRQAVLRDTAKDFLNRYENVVGLAGDYPWYRFASPYRKDQKLGWLQDIEANL